MNEAQEHTMGAQGSIQQLPIPDELRKRLENKLKIPVLDGNIIKEKTELVRTELSSFYREKKLSPDKFLQTVSGIASAIQKQLRAYDPNTNYVDLLCGPNISALLLTSSTFDAVDTQETKHVQVKKDITNSLNMDVAFFASFDNLQLDFSKEWAKSSYPHVQSLQVLTHGNLLSELGNFGGSAIKVYDEDTKSFLPITVHEREPSQKKPGDMVFAFEGNCVIRASNLFELVQKNRNKKVPLFVMTVACHSGQARNDVAHLGKNAILLTFIGRKYQARLQYNLLNVFFDKNNRLANEIKGEARYMGPLQWARDCVASGVNFNISLTNDKGEQVLWEGGKLYHIKKEEHFHLLKPNITTKFIVSEEQSKKDIVAQVQCDEKRLQNMKTSIKGGPEINTLLGVFSKDIKNGADMLAVFQPYLKEKYCTIIDKVPLNTLKQLGYQDKDEAKAQWSDVNLTEMDVYQHLFTALSFVLDHREKDRNLLLEIMANKGHPVNQSLQKLIGLDLHDEELYSLLPPSSAVNFLSMLRNNNLKYALESFIKSSKDKERYKEKFKELCSAGHVFLADDQYSVLLSQATNLDVEKIKALRITDAVSLNNEQYEILCKNAQYLTAEKIRTLCTFGAHSLGDVKYKRLCQVAAGLDMDKIKTLTTLDASLLSDIKYNLLCNQAVSLTYEKIQALCDYKLHSLPTEEYLKLRASNVGVEDIRKKYDMTIQKKNLKEAQEWEKKELDSTKFINEEEALQGKRRTDIKNEVEQLQESLKLKSLKLELEPKKLQQQQQEHQGHQGDLQISQQQQLLQQQASITKGLEDYKSIVKQFGYSNEKEGNAWLALKDSMIKYQSNDLWYKQKCEEYDQLGKKRLQADPPTQNQNNLRRYGKGEGESEMMEELVEANVGKGAVLEEMRRRVESEVKMDEKQGEKRSGKAGQVEVLGEVHDEHGASVQMLVERMEKMSEEEGKRSVVALERKEGGEHLGMRDVRLLAGVLRHNEGCKEEEKMKLPAGVEGTALWWDAKLVSEAQKHGVQVVGVEGKGLAHGQQSPEYNADREDYMAQKLQQLQRQGYNVVMPVGEAHVKGLQSRLGANTAVDVMGTMQQNNQQNSQSKEHDILQLSVNAEMEARQQNNQQNSQSNGQSTSRATQTTAKKVYGKFTERLAESGSQSHGMV